MDLLGPGQHWINTQIVAVTSLWDLFQIKYLTYVCHPILKVKHE